MTFRPHHIEIDGGIRKTAGFPTGGYVFLIDLVEEDGCRLTLWDGRDYAAAIREAEAARVSFGITEPVRDIVAGGAA